MREVGLNPINTTVEKNKSGDRMVVLPANKWCAPPPPPSAFTQHFNLFFSSLVFEHLDYLVAVLVSISMDILGCCSEDKGTRVGTKVLEPCHTLIIVSCIQITEYLNSIGTLMPNNCIVKRRQEIRRILE